MTGVKVKQMKETKLAYIEHKGSYSEIPYDEYFTRLYDWAKEKKVRPGFKPLGIFYDDPDNTPSEECRSEICIPIKGEAESDEDVRIKEIPSMEVAVLKHKGTSEEYRKTYRDINKWMEDNGYEWAGPAMEVFTKKPKVKDEETILYANVQVPIKKKVKVGTQKLRKLAEKKEGEEEEEKEEIGEEEEKEEETKEDEG